MSAALVTTIREGMKSSLTERIWNLAVGEVLFQEFHETTTTLPSHFN
jgi:hypothetical protein